jgi:hypothetical protein
MIPYKLFSQLTDRLLDFRTNPNDTTNQSLFDYEQFVNWPYAANNEQLTEWEDINNRTRIEYENKVNQLKGV